MTVALLVAAAVALAGLAVLGAPVHGQTSRGRALGASGDAAIAPLISRRHRSVAVAALIGVGTLAAVATGPGPMILVAAAVATVGAWRRRQRRAATQRAVEEAMPDAVELFVVALHAGRSPAQAVVELARIAPAPVRPAFAAVEHRLHRGDGVGDALDELTARCGRSALGLVTAVGAAVRDGLPLTPVLDRMTDDANATRRRQGEAAARRLPVRLSFPLVACTLPSFVLLAIAPAVLGAISTLRGTAP